MGQGSANAYFKEGERFAMGGKVSDKQADYLARSLQSPRAVLDVRSLGVNYKTELAPKEFLDMQKDFNIKPDTIKVKENVYKNPLLGIDVANTYGYTIVEKENPGFTGRFNKLIGRSYDLGSYNPNTDTIKISYPSDMTFYHEVGHAGVERIMIDNPGVYYSLEKSTTKAVYNRGWNMGVLKELYPAYERGEIKEEFLADTFANMISEGNNLPGGKMNKFERQLNEWVTPAIANRLAVSTKRTKVIEVFPEGDWFKAGSVFPESTVTYEGTEMKGLGLHKGLVDLNTKEVLPVNINMQERGVTMFVEKPTQEGKPYEFFRESRGVADFKVNEELFKATYTQKAQSIGVEVNDRTFFSLGTDIKVQRMINNELPAQIGWSVKSTGIGYARDNEIFAKQNVQWFKFEEASKPSLREGDLLFGRVSVESEKVMQAGNLVKVDIIKLEGLGAKPGMSGGIRDFFYSDAEPFAEVSSLGVKREFYKYTGGSIRPIGGMFEEGMVKEVPPGNPPRIVSRGDFKPLNVKGVNQGNVLSSFTGGETRTNLVNINKVVSIVKQQVRFGETARIGAITAGNVAESIIGESVVKSFRVNKGVNIPLSESRIGTGSILSNALLPKTTIRNDIRSELRGELRPVLVNELRSELRPSLRNDMRGELRNELRGELRSELRGELRSELRSELKSELMTNKKTNLRTNLRSNIRPNIPFTPSITIPFNLSLGSKRKTKGRRKKSFGLFGGFPKSEVFVLPDLRSVNITEAATGREAIAPRLIGKTKSLAYAAFQGRSAGFIPTEQMRLGQLRSKKKGRWEL